MKIEIQGQDQYIEQVAQELRSQLEAEGIHSDYESITREKQKGLMEWAAIISIVSGTVTTGDIVVRAIKSRNPQIERMIVYSNNGRAVSFENFSTEALPSISKTVNEILEEERL